ncbi:TPA: phage antirepressor KilAC domain-containing protein [Streptococcus equi subsp. zooepidemicus]|nr:phage antirepressor KilAC domain-containing protein [Streptococcus equi subsp. zooepidemicus]
MNELINITLNENQEPVTTARKLHEALGISQRFSRWVENNFVLFTEGQDYNKCTLVTVVNNGAKRELEDYTISLMMAKHLSMMTRTPKGFEVRDYFIQVEKDFNSPEKIMARALLMADKKVHKLEAQIEADRPKVLFANAVEASETSILIGDFAKILRQNGYEIGQNRLFEWLRNNGFLIRKKGESYNMPTQRSMDMKLFEVKERTHQESNGSIRISKTTKLTGKGQQYFINKFLNQEYLQN